MIYFLAGFTVILGVFIISTIIGFLKYLFTGEVLKVDLSDGVTQFIISAFAFGISILLAMLLFIVVCWFIGLAILG